MVGVLTNTMLAGINVPVLETLNIHTFIRIATKAVNMNTRAVRINRDGP
jgi:hypothetical protein